MQIKPLFAAGVPVVPELVVDDSFVIAHLASLSCAIGAVAHPGVQDRDTCQTQSILADDAIAGLAYDRASQADEPRQGRSGALLSGRT
ncbi:hypothetical protein [Pseudoruegeria sp. SK021]|uniref:hypothetical protein n=1 Tax=Pseudoruegeria sp. SK021 TaxID=1933035 RepID=UPI000A322960|nr:hypothetical protein [Pseudoruegeria sp. SK021]